MKRTSKHVHRPAGPRIYIFGHVDFSIEARARLVSKQPRRIK